MIIGETFPRLLRICALPALCTPVGLLHMALLCWHLTYALSPGDSVTKVKLVK